MSDTQFPTDEPTGAPSPTPSVEEANPSQATDTTPSLPDEIEIGGQMFSREEVEGTIEDWGKMQAAHTQRSQEVAEQRRALEQREAEIARRESEMSNGRSNQVEDEDPDLAQQLLGEIREIKGAQTRMEERYSQSMAQVERQSDMEKAVGAFKGKPLFNDEEMHTFMDSNSMGPEQAGVAYQALYGRRIGQSVGETLAASRRVEPVMGSTGPTGVSPGFTSVQDAPTPPVPVSDTSWEEFERQAAEDPGIM